MMVTFSHEWDSSLKLADAWEAIVIAFENSRRSTVWPNELAEVRAPAGALKEGSEVEVQYKIGSLRAGAQYRISRLIPNSLLRYDAQTSHPLSGGAEILLFALPSGTHLVWRGSYQSKGILSWSSLLWFKGLYERRFFGRFIRNFQQLKTSKQGA